MSTITRPGAGELEQRTLPDAPAPTVQGNTLHGLIPYGVESRDLGGFTEQIAPGALTAALKDDLVCTLNHDVSRVLGRHPTTLKLEDRAEGMVWSCELPSGPTGADVREAVSRGDLRATSWRMIVGRDSWHGDRRTVEEIRELRDVAVVTNPSYPGAVAELRSEPEPSPAAPAAERKPEEATVPESTSAPGGLVVEDRTAADDQPTVETRVMEALRGVNKGEARDLATSTVANVSPPELSEYLFQRLRPASVALASGITTLSTDRESIQWPKLTADVAPGFVAEGAQIPEGDPAFATLTATPKKIAHRVVVSNEVIDDSVPAITDVLSANLALRLALKLDLAVFEGDGTANSITGLKNTSGIQTLSMGTNGSTFANLDPFADAIGLLNAVNAPGDYVIVMHPSLWQALSKLKVGSSYNSPLLAFPGDAAAPRIYGAPVYITSQLSTTETQGSATTTTSAYVYAASQVVLVRRMDATIELDRSRLFDHDQSEMRGKLRADLLVPNPEAVVRILGVKTS